MRRKKLVLALFSIMFFLLPLFTVVYAEVVVITNNSVVDNLGVKDIKEIFLGKKKYWDNNQPITLFILQKSPAHEEFITKYLGKSEFQFNNYWKQLLFTGRGMMPAAVSGEDLVELIKRTEGAIGYIPAEMDTEGVRVTRLE